MSHFPSHFSYMGIPHEQLGFFLFVGAAGAGAPGCGGPAGAHRRAQHERLLLALLCRLHPQGARRTDKDGPTPSTQRINYMICTNAAR